MSDEKPGRPAPKPNVFTDAQAFWDGAKAGKLMLQFCPETKQFQHFPRPVSMYTGKRKLEWREASGKGTIYSCTVVRVPGPGLEGRLPLPVAMVELDEGVRIIGNILNRPTGEVKIGQRVELAWDQLDGGVNYPAFNVV